MLRVGMPGGRVPSPCSVKIYVHPVFTWLCISFLNFGSCRYCPSIESKVLKFSNRNHQVWLEPEGTHPAICMLIFITF